ncbi:hypothetical protein K9U39_02625 [Rhodoblastus acidophilus]|uniref:Uncharacterized protein n=1 Tax=Candidatus Rhodoblastus alkanivorans TaxID=2954117 RepID=A0ABS9Z4L8_9HYPH|nr:hypothetical protein [Candidatus Rhodoblastus alkanivorans]MCI4677726.1 hypothetical protein [Candidatus Rhodoblastus alkanivorans]MCI4682542.1 hypothetical protein [Candidatus Rhodoblastus alkanivorans]MDI4639848.1 hypothetical protein [Rhodoblastus acidophilus]
MKKRAIFANSDHFHAKTHRFPPTATIQLYARRPPQTVMQRAKAGRARGFFTLPVTRNYRVRTKSYGKTRFWSPKSDRGAAVYRGRFT